MELTKRYPKFGLVIAIFTLLLPVLVQAQYGSHGPYGVGEFKEGKHILTKEMETQLNGLVSMFAQECARGKVIDAISHSDSLRYKNVSEHMSNLLNAKLAWRRADEPIRYLVDKGVEQECFDDIQWKPADSKDRVVSFMVRLSRDKQADLILENEARIDSVEAEIADLIEKNKEQDERLDDHRTWIDENTVWNQNQDTTLNNHEQRLRYLEKQKWDEQRDTTSIDVSGHLGLNVEHFASQLAPTISAGVQIGRLDLTGWYGFMPNTGTVDLDIGTVNTRRETYGGMATLYVLDNSRISVGPSIGWEHGEDAIEGRGSYVKVYESALVGASADIKLIGPLHLKVSAAYTPVIKSYSYDNQVLQDESSNLRLSAGISVTF